MVVVVVVVVVVDADAGLADNDIGDDGAKSIAGALKKNRSITKLDLGCL